MPVLADAVVPALVAAFGESARAAARTAASREANEAACVDRLYAAVLGGGQREALEAVRELAEGGPEDVERALCVVLPAVVERVENACRCEECSEADRTVAMCILRGLLDRLEGQGGLAARPTADAPVVLLWSPSGDRLGFDLSLLGHLLRRSGAVVETQEGAPAEAVLDDAGRGGTDAVVVWAGSRAGGRKAVDLAEAIAGAPRSCEVLGLGEPVRAACEGKDGAPSAAPAACAQSAAEACAMLRRTVMAGRGTDGPACELPCPARVDACH